MRNRGISFVQLNRFLLLTEMLHFSRAAEKLGITQPLLSEQIKSLEFQVGTKLLNRTSRRVTLTPAGELLAERTRLILHALEDAVQAAREAGRRSFSRIRIGYTDEFTTILSDIIRSMKAVEPEASIETFSFTVPQLVQALQSGALDLGLACPLPERLVDNDLHVRVLPPVPLSVGIATSHKLAGAASLSLADIADENFIEGPLIPPAASEIVVERLFAHEGLKRRIVQRCDNLPLGVSLAAAGVGILVADLQSSPLSSELSVIPLNAKNATLTRGAIWRRSWSTNLLDICQDYLERNFVKSVA